MENPKIRFKGFTKDWEQRKLGDIAGTTYGGGTPKTSVDEYWNGVIPWIQSSNLSEDELFNADIQKGITDLGLQKSATQLVPENSIAVVTHVGVGKLVFMPFKYTTSQDFISLSELKSDPIFTCYALYRRLQKDLYIVQGSAIKGITKEDLLSKNIMVPNLEEQKKIGITLQSVDNLITLHQRKLDSMKEYKKGLLQKMFPKQGEKVPEIRFPGFTDDWEQRKVGELIKDHNAGIYISKDKYGEGTNVIGVGNIYDSDIFDGKVYRLGPVDDNKFLLDEGDLVYGESSLVLEGIARTICVGKNGAGSAFAWHTRRVKLDKTRINPHFATLELNYHPVVRKHLMSVATQTALTGMTTDGYFSAPLSLPCIEEQKRISELFINLDNLITLHQRKLDQMKEYKKGLLQKMFV